MYYFLTGFLGFILGLIISNRSYRKKLSHVYLLEEQIEDLNKRLKSTKDIVKILLSKRKSKS